MKMKDYKTPELEIFEVMVEQGFADSMQEIEEEKPDIPW